MSQNSGSYGHWVKLFDSEFEAQRYFAEMQLAENEKAILRIPGKNAAGKPEIEIVIL